MSWVGSGRIIFSLNYTDLQWVASSTLGLGLPLLSLMLDRGRERASRVRLLQSAGWLLCVLIPPLLAHQFVTPGVPSDAPVVSYEQFLRQPGAKQAVTLPAGMKIPVKFDVTGNLFRASDEVTFPLVLNEPLLVMMNEGKPTGEMRANGGDWLPWHDTLTILIPRITAQYDTGYGALIRSSLIVKVNGQNSSTN